MQVQQCGEIDFTVSMEVQYKVQRKGWGYSNGATPAPQLVCGHAVAFRLSLTRELHLCKKMVPAQAAASMFNLLVPL